MEALRSLQEMRDNSETIALLYHATGTGKTVTAVMDAKRCGGRVLFLAHTQELVSQATETFRMQTVDLFTLRCPVCGFPLKYEFNKNYGLNLWICTNEAEVCDFMTNDKVHKHDICKCPKCKDGYLIVRKNVKNGDIFYGCTNYYNDEHKCTNMIRLSSDPV